LFMRSSIKRLDDQYSFHPRFASALNSINSNLCQNFKNNEKHQSHRVSSKSDEI
jgi:hypothetical protein